MTQEGIKYRAVVVDVTDPDNLGRIRAKIIGAEDRYAKTSWCYAVSPFAGPGFGWYFLPEIGDVVYVEQSQEGDWLWVGCCWTTEKAKPADGSASVRVLKTPAGHLLRFAESGSVMLEHQNGSKVELATDDLVVEHSGGSIITLESGGNIVIEAEGDIHLNGSGGKVVTTQCVCCFTGKPHPQGSLTVKAKGII